ncbi:protein AF-9 [Copidosoma floridanum]|uniref:protein AF-9 n=1 Tax=Copidosoma floridanum TaxID=29053 RepID=UPI0006C9485A|nr:protein AF-9 [Copidosoma floridanum]
MMGYRISLECGDTSSLRSKKTPDGFTHDWEVWIKGVDDAPIHHYIERVVFNLHETFPKPKRVIKEPPYCLTESGYAGFDIPIHVYLKNKNEPKRFDILYNLNLDTSTPTVSHRSLHNEVIVNPTEEFRKKLLKGGAILTNVDSPLEKNETKTLSMVGKPKLSGNSEVKKHRIVEPKTSNQFNDLFGPPIKTAKLTQEIKKTSEKPNSLKAPAVPEKSDKVDKSTKVKHSPHKDSKKDKSSEEKKEKKEKEKDGVKDKEKSKDKSKRSSSPSVSKVSQHSLDKRPSSPTIKKTSSPAPTVKRLSSPSSKPKEKESKKDPEKDRDREKEKSKDSSKSNPIDEVKTERSEKESKIERKKDRKKHKEDRDKEKKDKHRDREREKSKDKEGVKSIEKKVEKPEKVEKEKSEIKPIKEEKKSPKTLKEDVKPKEEKILKPEKIEKSEKEKSKESKSEKSDKSKHKHKKKEKKEKRDGSREREKKDKREKSKSSSESKGTEVTNPTPTPTPTVLVPTRVQEIVDRDSSDTSGDEDSVVETRLSSGSAPKKELPSPAPPAEVHRTMSPPPAPAGDKKDKSDRKHDRSKGRREEKEGKKRKRKSESKGPADDEIVPVKKGKDRDHSTSPLVEPVSSSQSPIATNADLLLPKVKHEDPTVIEPTAGDSEQVAPDSTNSTLVDTEEPLVFSEDYVLQLKELQQKIMTLQDNQELQRVVQVIAETGQYEITKKTFDFDLCTLDRRTVQRLQQFFAS